MRHRDGFLTLPYLVHAGAVLSQLRHDQAIQSEQTRRPIGRFVKSLCHFMQVPQMLTSLDKVSITMKL